MGDNTAARDQAGKCNMTGHGPLVRMVASWTAIAGTDWPKLSLLQMRWVGWLEK